MNEIKTTTTHHSTIGTATEAKAKILVVDDDLRLRQLLERYLAEQGFTVKAVPDSESMNRALTRELYDLLVLDLMLPGTSSNSARAVRYRVVSRHSTKT